MPILPCVAALLLAACQDRPKTAFDGARALEYAREQVSFGPRIPGSPSHRRAGDWIVQQMRARADTVLVQEWTHVTATGDSLPMRNIIARYRPRETSRVLFLAHWDTRPISDEAFNLADRQMPVPGANDGASGVGLLVALGDVLKATPPQYGVDLLFVDGEDYGDFGKNQDVLIGSTYFAANPPEPSYRPLFGVLWDMIGDADLRILQEQYSMQSAPEVVARVWRAAEELGYGDIFVPRAGQAIIDDHVPLLRAGMRVIDVIDYDYPHHHRPTDTIDKISARSLQVVGDVAVRLVGQ